MYRPWVVTSLIFLGTAAAASPDDRLKVTSHKIQAHTEHGIAHLTSELHLRQGALATKAPTLDIVLPENSIVTGFETSFGAGSPWLSGDIYPASRAYNLFQDIVGFGDGPPGHGAAALLRSGLSDEALLQLHPLQGGDRIRVRVRLSTSVEIEDGHRVIYLPLGNGIPPTIHAPGAKISVVETHSVRGCSRAGGPSVRVAWPLEKYLDIAFGARQIGIDRALVHLSAEAGGLPNPAASMRKLVVVIDASYSQRTAGLERQIKLAQGVLKNAGAMQAEVVITRRGATRLIGRFISAGRLARHLRNVQIPLGNGSNIDAGLDTAAALLRRERQGGLIVLMTDGLLRRDLSPKDGQSARLASPRSIVHLVNVGHDVGLVELSLSEEHPWASVASASGGLAFRLLGQASGIQPYSQASRRLLRPEEIRRLQIQTQDGATTFSVPEVLKLGTGFSTTTVLNAKSPGSVILTGRLWSRRWFKVFTPDTTTLRNLIIHGFTHQTPFEESERKFLALDEGLLTDSTAYLVAPNLRQRSGREWVGMGAGGYGCSSCRGFRPFTKTTTPERSLPRYQALLREQVEPVVQNCRRIHNSNAPVAVHLETTLDEIVALRVRAPQRLLTCVRSAVWALKLKEVFVREHASYGLQFSARD